MFEKLLNLQQKKKTSRRILEKTFPNFRLVIKDSAQRGEHQTNIKEIFKQSNFQHAQFVPIIL